MTEPSPPLAADHIAVDFFRPSRSRALFAAGVAAVGAVLPQEIPLEYYPLNNPSAGLQYLEIKCAANVDGMTEIFLDHGRGFNGLDKIQLPIGRSETTYTYTFPLVDAPLLQLRMDPFREGAGELTIASLRVINRRQEEITRFGPADFHSRIEMEVAAAEANSWKLVSNVGAKDPRILVRVKTPLVAEGMNERNLKRSLLSVGYLTMMLWIILLAVYFIFWLPRPRKAVIQGIAFLAFIAAMFSVVGNRGLIRNSLRYAYQARQLAAKYSG